MSGTVNITTRSLIKKRRDGQTGDINELTQGTNSESGVTSAGDLLATYFEVVNPGEADEYLRVKLPIGCDYEVQAFTDSGQMPASVWEGMPIASATVLGGIKVGSGLSITDGVLAVAAGGGMVYPGSGIALSTGSSWGASIANNSGNWNTAYSHTSLTNNPHVVTASQVGLGNVTNESKATMFTNAVMTGSLQVQGNSELFGSTYKIYGQNDASNYYLGHYAVSGADGLMIHWYGGVKVESGSRGIRLEGDVTTFYTNVAPAGNTVIYDFQNNTVSVFNITQAGNVGISTGGLTVYGSVQANGMYTTSQLTVGSYHSTTKLVFGNDVNHFINYNSTADGIDLIGYQRAYLGASFYSTYLYVGNGAVYTNTNIQAAGEVTAYYSSDARLKQNIQSFSALDKIDRMRPVTFQWNDRARELNNNKDDRWNYGLVAQELEPVMPEMVHKIYDKYKSVDYVQLVPVLLQAVKELKQELNAIKNAN